MDSRLSIFRRYKTEILGYKKEIFQLSRAELAALIFRELIWLCIWLIIFFILCALLMLAGYLILDAAYRLVTGNQRPTELTHLLIMGNGELAGFLLAGFITTRLVRKWKADRRAKVATAQTTISQP